MEKRPRMKSPPRNRGIRSKKDKAKARAQKRESSSAYSFEEKHVPTIGEIVERTTNILHHLGDQRFVVSPFSEHFDRWTTNLRSALSEFEASPAVSLDDQFLNECSSILSNVEVDLEERRRKEASGEDPVRSLSEARVLLEQIEKEYAAKINEVEGRRSAEIRRLSSNIDGLRNELDDIARMKAGFFGLISKKAKAQKEAEANLKLDSARRELSSTEQRFAAEQETLQREYAARRQPVAEQIRGLKKRIESPDVDGSLEIRRSACEALINAVNTLLQRMQQIGSS